MQATQTTQTGGRALEIRPCDRSLSVIGVLMDTDVNYVNND